MKIKFLKDYSALLASQEVKIYHAGQILDCRNEDAARQMIDRGFAIVVE